MITAAKNIFIPDWPAPRNVKAIITQRLGGTSPPPYNSFNLSYSVGDSERNVTNNRLLLEKIIKKSPRWLNQIHGSNVILAETINDSEVEADGSFTRKNNVVCALTVADCVPVLICDNNGTTVAAIHAGWKGIFSGILETTVNLLSISSTNTLVYLGPGIGPKEFEIGPDVHEMICSQPSFKQNEILEHPKNNKWYANLFQIITNRFLAMQIENIYGGNVCTYSNPELYFSNRRDNPTGRMAACIWLEQ